MVLILVFIYVYLDYYIYTINDMKNEMDYLNHYNVSVYNHDFEQVFQKIDDAMEMHLI